MIDRHPELDARCSQKNEIVIAVRYGFRFSGARGKAATVGLENFERGNRIRSEWIDSEVEQGEQRESESHEAYAETQIGTMPLRPVRIANR